MMSCKDRCREDDGESERSRRSRRIEAAGDIALFFCTLFGFIFAAYRQRPPIDFPMSSVRGGVEGGRRSRTGNEKGGREDAFEIKGSVGHPPRTFGQLK